MRRIETESGPRYEMDDGSLITEDEFDDWLEEMKEANGPADELKIQGNWRNFKSDGLAVHPDQCELAEQRNKLHGCSVTYDREDGRAIIPDRAERKRLLRIEKFHDNDAGYSD